MTTSSAPTVAISVQFLKAFSNIPLRQQGKVREFIEKFRREPGRAGLNLEPIKQAADPNLRSVRIDQDYRAILLKPERGQVFLLLWVAYHDDAYRWAERKRCLIHPDTGALQIFDTSMAEQARPAVIPESASPKGLFDGHRDRELQRLGIPEVLLPLVRSVVDEAGLDRVAPYLPEEAADALYMLASGFGLEETLRELQERFDAGVQVDQADFAAALEKDDSLRRFHVLTDDLELQAMLAAPLEQWRVFLHPLQRKLVSMKANGPVRVLGGAGTGKTVVAMHRARHLVREIFTGEHDRILFTTFTRNLAADIRANLAAICTREELRRIEVVNLDAWVCNLLRNQGYAVQWIKDEEIRELWQHTMTVLPEALEGVFNPEFYREEWERVVQAQGIQTREDYLKVQRSGRGTKLTRVQRGQLWEVFEAYRAELNARNRKELIDLYREARQLLATRGNVLAYRAVVIDEAQDFGDEAYRLLRHIVPAETSTGNDLFLVGDAHQRIYGRSVVLGRCGIDIRGRGKRLKINYRTTEEIRRWAMALYEGCSVDDLDNGLDEVRGFRSLVQGVSPVVKHFATEEEEFAFLCSHLEAIQAHGTELRQVCLTARTNKLIQGYTDR